MKHILCLILFLVLAYSATAGMTVVYSDGYNYDSKAPTQVSTQSPGYYSSPDYDSQSNFRIVVDFNGYLSKPQRIISIPCNDYAKENSYVKCYAVVIDTSKRNYDKTYYTEKKGYYNKYGCKKIPDLDLGNPAITGKFGKVEEEDYKEIQQRYFQQIRKEKD
ncbi:MAG: hypothetical protein V1859_07035 [archaeon]